MSTNSTIAVKTDKGYEAIYCHWDGYPSYMYPMLRDWYGTQERAEALVGYGDASFIAKRLEPSVGSGHCFEKPEEDVCVFYCRDRGEEWHGVCYETKREVLSSQYYVYIFYPDENLWRAYEGGKEVDSYEY